MAESFREVSEEERAIFKETESRQKNLNKTFKVIENLKRFAKATRSNQITVNDVYMPNHIIKNFNVLNREGNIIVTVSVRFAHKGLPQKINNYVMISGYGEKYYFYNSEWDYKLFLKLKEISYDYMKKQGKVPNWDDELVNTSFNWARLEEIRRRS